MSAMDRIPMLMEYMERHLADKKDVLFGKQHRQSKFLSFKGSFAVGTGVCHNTFNKNIGKHAGFLKHNFKNIGVYNLPITQQQPKWPKKTRSAKVLAYLIARAIITAVDEDFAAGEYVVQFAYMKGGGHVGWHKDAHDISYQYALSLGDFSGATLRVYKRDHKKGQRATQPFHEFDYRNKIVKFDGRRPHEVVTDKFEGERFTVIFYKSYDHRKTAPDPILKEPEVVFG
jgi:hypothetical protein